MVICSRRKKGRGEVPLSYNTTAHNTYSFAVDGFFLALHTLKFIFQKWDVKIICGGAVAREITTYILYSPSLLSKVRGDVNRRLECGERDVNRILSRALFFISS
jgi:hypothetical protein